MQNLVINEWQLDNKLSSALKKQQRSSFQLYLSMMSQNLLELAEFDTPGQTVDESESIDLKKRFAVFPAVKLHAEKADYEIEAQRRMSLNTPSQLRLQLAMFPPSIALRNDPKHIDYEVVSLMPVHSARHLQQGVDAAPQLRLDEPGLLDVLDQVHGRDYKSAVSLHDNA